jgi:hypothetical protein
MELIQVLLQLEEMVELDFNPALQGLLFITLVEAVDHALVEQQEQADLEVAEMEQLE